MPSSSSSSGCAQKLTEHILSHRIGWFEFHGWMVAFNVPSAPFLCIIRRIIIIIIIIKCAWAAGTSHSISLLFTITRTHLTDLNRLEANEPIGFLQCTNDVCMHTKLMSCVDWQQHQPPPQSIRAHRTHKHTPIYNNNNNKNGQWVTIESTKYSAMSIGPLLLLLLP